MEGTPERMPMASPQGKRLSEAKKSVNECIHMVSDKKQMNQEAIGEVQQINSEILNSLSNYNPAKQGLY